MTAASRGDGPSGGVNRGEAVTSKAFAGSSAGEQGLEEAPDADLVERVQGGDAEAFRELFDRYHRRAYAVALGVVKNPSDAKDVVQEAFVKVHRHIPRFQGSSSFYTWLYRIVMNLAIDHVRRRKNRRGVEYDDRLGRDDEEVAGDGTLLPRILDANPGRTVARKELLERIQAALDELPEYHRAVILLREVEGMSYEEMAEALDVPKGTIMSRLFHARKKMQAALSEYIQGELTIED
ncbi:MAG: sigma-70 family RNA polymerase sigma factor [Sandaracinaceae bacterium]